MWNWQQSDWPEFRWNESRLGKAEVHFLKEAGRFAGVMSHLDRAGQQQITVEAMSSEALTTSEIEGEILDRASVQSSIRKALGLAGGTRKEKTAESGISKMTVDLHRTFARPLSSQMLFAWHEMAMSGRQDLRDPGRYRTGADPMQVMSGGLGDPAIHFEAPPASRVSAEMKRFLKWFNRAGPDGMLRFQP